MHQKKQHIARSLRRMKVTLITRCLHFTDLRPAFISSPREAISPSYAPTLTERENEWENKLAFQKERERERKTGERSDQVILRRLLKMSKNSRGCCVYTYTNNSNHQMYKRHWHENTNVQNYVFSGECRTQEVHTAYRFTEEKTIEYSNPPPPPNAPRAVLTVKRTSLHHCYVQSRI